MFAAYARGIAGVVLIGVAAGLVAGCGGSATEAPEPPAKSVAAAGGHNLGGWWCTEHGVPEEECARCDTSLVSEFKAKGDWCTEHERPESQCFACDPSRFDKFAARFKAKFGDEPPQPRE